MSKIPVLITSALPYVNNYPHLGNLIGSTLSADVYSRYMKSFKKETHDTLYLCGTDEYGTTTEVRAKKENMSCQEICDKYHKIHKEVYDWFDIDFDIFGRTSTKTQTELTHEIFLDLYRNGHIEHKEIEQRFCEKCDMFLADRYLKGICYLCKADNTNGDQCDRCNNLLDPLLFDTCWCLVCKENPVIKKTKHMYLKLNDFTEQLTKHFIIDRKVKMSENAYNITKAFIEQGLESRCITRDLKWGTSIPQRDEFPELQEYKDKVFYVWFDAPIGYLSILKKGICDPDQSIDSDKTTNNDWTKWLYNEDKNGEIVQFMAKDNVSFHTVIFPATLLGSKRYPLLTSLSSAEYLDYEGKKFSKTDNIGIFGNDVIELSERYGLDSDYWRYYLIRIRPETHDSSFKWNEFSSIVKSDLVNKIGNFINRCISLSYKLYASEENPETKMILFEKDKTETLEEYIKLQDICNRYHEYFEKFKLRDAQKCIVELAELGNEFLQVNKPWILSSKQKQDITYANYIVCKMIELMAPFLPKRYQKLSKNFIFKESKIYVSNVNYDILFKNFII